MQALHHFVHWSILSSCTSSPVVWLGRGRSFEIDIDKMMFNVRHTICCLTGEGQVIWKIISARYISVDELSHSSTITIWSRRGRCFEIDVDKMMFSVRQRLLDHSFPCNAMTGPALTLVAETLLPSPRRFPLWGGGLGGVDRQWGGHQGS